MNDGAAIIGSVVAVAIAAALMIAAIRIPGPQRGGRARDPVRDRRALRYLAIALALGITTVLCVVAHRRNRDGRETDS